MKVPSSSYSLTDFDDSEVEIGEYTSIAKDCYFHGADNHHTAIDRNRVSNNIPKTTGSKGKIIIGNDVWIGLDVKILSGSHIGDGAIVGAHSVVSGNVPPYAVVAGNPARVVKYRFEPDVVARLLGIKWWFWNDARIQEGIRNGLFDDVTNFLNKNND